MARGLEKLQGSIPPVVLLSVEEVAPIFRTTPMKLSAAIRNGTLPIGFSIEGDKASGERGRTVIVLRRLQRWLNGDDLGGKCEWNTR